MRRSLEGNNGRHRFRYGLDHAGHLVRLVAHALRLAVALEGNQQTQIARSGLTAGNDGGEFVVDLHFHRVHTLLYGGHLPGFHAELGQGVNRLANLRLHQPPSSITREETLLSSLSNWVEMFFWHGVSSAETAGDVVFGFLALGLEEHLLCFSNSTRSPRYM